jgi:phosphate transport system substrate-binding protein
MTTTWRQLGWRSSPDRVAACLPDQNAGEFEVVATKIIHGQKFGPANRAGSSPEMLSFVVNHPAALGFVSIGWLGDYKDKVKVLELSDPAAPDSLGIQGQYFTPHQAHIYRGYYPLTSDVYIYSRADMYSVAAGFITFVTSAPGQKIVLNDGLVPATMPVRLVEITDKALQQ